MPTNTNIGQATVCADPTQQLIWNMLSQRRQKNALAIAPPRLTLISLYPAHTKMQLDMRRKVEILKYQGQNTQSNNLTKAQKWAQMTRSNYSNISVYKIDNNSDSVCESIDKTPTLTSACDVPGPPIYLINDPSVPLYNYISRSNSATLPYQPNTADFNIYTLNELLQVQSSSLTIINNYIKTREIRLGSLIVNNPSPDPQPYTIQTPLAIWCTGIYVGSEPVDPNSLQYGPRADVGPINISIASIFLNITYNGVAVYDPISIPVNTLSNVLISPNQTDTQLFYAIQYIGNATLQFELTSEFNCIYDLSLTVNYIYAISVAEKINAFEAGVFCNLSETNQNIYANPVPSTTLPSWVSPIPSPPLYTSSFINYTNLVSALPI